MTEGSDQKSAVLEVLNRSYCGSSESIFYAVGTTGQIVHISTVQKGLQCGCTCPECGAPLVAKKGPVKVQHFAHAAHTGCGGGPETALHRFAKQIIAERLTLLLPDMIAQYGAAERLIRQGLIYRFDSVEVEQPLQDASAPGRQCLVPDLFLWKSDRRMMVEIHVTHPCDDQKIARLREQDIAAIEIDLSALPRNTPPRAVEEAVLSTAPRKWIFHKNIEAAVKTMMAEAQETAARERKKREQAAQRLQTEADDYEEAYRSGVADLEKSAPFSPDATSEIGRARLMKYIGERVDGYGCFLVRPEVWQSAVLTEFLRGAHMGGCRTAQIRDDLQRKGWVRPRFRFVKGEHETVLEGRDIGFKSPYGAIEAYLDTLAQAKVLSKFSGKYFLSSVLNDHLQSLREADERRRQRTEDIKRRVLTLLEKLPAEDKTGFSPPEWFRRNLNGPDTSVAAAIAADSDKTRRMLSAFTSVESMILRGDRIVDDTLGLPVERQRERLREQRRIEAEAREAERLRAAEADRSARLTEVTKAAHSLLPTLDAEAWLNTSFARLNDRTPAAAAQESPSGLKEAIHELSIELDRRERERDRQRGVEVIRQKLIRAAQQEMGVEAGQVFCGGTHPKLGYRRPIDYCVDESTLQTCLALFPGKKRRR